MESPRPNDQRTNDWQASIAATGGTHHVDQNTGQPLYKTRFDRILPFHPPGLAAVHSGDQAFHIFSDGTPAYPARFDRTFGFYNSLAAVVIGNEWFHIHPDGTKSYKRRWSWCGNFQQNRCAVRSNKDYYHIRKDGTELPGGPHEYAGDFSEEMAVVRSQTDGLCRHITLEGELAHKESFFDLGVFHKGIATAKDAEGWFHISRSGKDVSGGKRYLAVEPFYNGQALVKTLDGEVMVVDEAGDTTVKIDRSDKERRADIHKASIAYWQPLAIRAGILLGIAGGKPALKCPLKHIEIVKRSWIDLSLLDAKGRLTPLGRELMPGKISRDRNLFWTGLQFKPWQAIEERLVNNADSDFFASKDHAAQKLISHVLDSYAKDDWSGIEKILRISDAKTIADLGGGRGRLLAELSAHNNKKILLDLPSVVQEKVCKKIESIGVDFFNDPLPEADVYILSRVLHDWPNNKAVRILERIPAASEIIVIDRVDDSGKHGLLSLNMLLTNGASERTSQEWETLFDKSNLAITSKACWRGHQVMWLSRKHQANGV